VVWFNENLDDAVIDRIDDELDETDLLLIIGGDYAAQCLHARCSVDVAALCGVTDSRTGSSAMHKQTAATPARVMIIVDLSMARRC
jgi:hypothetical protein